MIKIKDPDHGHADHIWVIEVDFGEVSLTTHHIAEIEIGDYAYLKSASGMMTLFALNELSDNDVMGVYTGISERYGICTVKDVIPW